MTYLPGGEQAPPCVMCLAPATKQCSGCHAFWYCGRDCQRKHWKSHKTDCGRVKDLQEMTAKKLLVELEDREREFHKVTELVRQHRETASCKTVWVTRSGDMLRQDLEDAKELPGIKDQLDTLDAKTSSGQQETLNTLFSAAEGVGRAKSLAFFEQSEPIKERLREIARRDDDQGIETLIKCGGQEGVVLPGLGEQDLAVRTEDLAAIRPSAAAAHAAAIAVAAETKAQVEFVGGAGRMLGESGELDQGTAEAIDAMRRRMQAALGNEAPPVR
mmetsp:Transcript_36727/g.105783  ORF Transcript_36727/g.105783 Transcript_36727/m.105783 type:complete len:273 (+) Transcript_36727:154-972(+)